MSEAREIALNIKAAFENAHTISGARKVVKVYMGEASPTQMVDNVAEELASHVGYQGWSNRETWCLALHLDNTQAWYETARLISQGAGSTFAKADKLFHFCEELMPDPRNDQSRFMWDMVKASLSRVNWEELLSHYEFKRK